MKKMNTMMMAAVLVGVTSTVAMPSLLNAEDKPDKIEVPPIPKKPESADFPAYLSNLTKMLNQYDGILTTLADSEGWCQDRSTRRTCSQINHYKDEIKGFLEEHKALLPDANSIKKSEDDFSTALDQQISDYNELQKEIQSIADKTPPTPQSFPAKCINFADESPKRIQGYFEKKEGSSTEKVFRVLDQKNPNGYVDYQYLPNIGLIGTRKEFTNFTPYGTPRYGYLTKDGKVACVSNPIIHKP